MDCYAAQNLSRQPLWIGCAGWSLSSAVQPHFAAGSSHLERYASVLPAVEINSSFYRPHRPATYARWRDSVPDAFRFAVKVPKEITHALRLRQVQAPLEKFIAEASHLQPKLGCLLVQLPPGLPYDPVAAPAFFDLLRGMTEVALVCEPRHRSWFAAEPAAALAQRAVSYVIADPPVAPLPAQALPPLAYYRLHGSPQMYHSAYPEAYLARLAADIARDAQAGKAVWCIFDNTASGAAVPNALSLLSLLARLQQAQQPA